jgi:predicted component of type VI protein secretion system
MILVLQGVALDEQPISQPLVGRFDERGGTLGRSDTVTFTLPDPQRTISRVQAQVLHGDDGFWLENVSAANPILHNDRPLSSGMRVLLRAGDELGIGGYTLRAAFEQDDEGSATVLRGRTIITQPGAGPGSAPALNGAPEPDGEDLWRDFLKGAGITGPLPERPSIELMNTVGAMLRIAIEGLYRLVAKRALAKDEMQAPLTMTRVRDTNPLKFAPDAAVALQLMLNPPPRGFLAGPAALHDALIELESHQSGVVAGMRAALEGVLDRFDPTKLEATLGTGSLLDSLQPARHKARLWQLYLEHFRSLRLETQEDFQHFFGKALREGYEARMQSAEDTTTVE